jgi:serine/threonine protein kinase
MTEHPDNKSHGPPELPATGSYVGDQGTHIDDLPSALADHPRYRVLKKLGYGGMGIVYLAEHRLMERKVALKTMRYDRASPDFVQRFLREVRATAQLSHPNIVTVFDAKEAGDLLFLVTELIEGPDLYDYVYRTHPLPIGAACGLTRQVAIGLEHAHQRGIIHRDINPNNLILDRSDFDTGAVVKIVDFGLARFLDEARGYPMTPAGFAMGTRGYMAPEQASDARTAGIHSDIFSLGRTLYYLLTNERPADSLESDGSWELIVTGVWDPAPVQRFRPDVPTGLVNLIYKMTARKLRDRYQTCDQVAKSLEYWCTA